MNTDYCEGCMFAEVEGMYVNCLKGDFCIYQELLMEWL